LEPSFLESLEWLCFRILLGVLTLTFFENVFELEINVCVCTCEHVVWVGFLAVKEKSKHLSDWLKEPCGPLSPLMSVYCLENKP